MNTERDPFEAELDGFPVAADPEHLQARETLEVLISRFTEEVRRGENPSIEEYARRNRHLADEIREIFPLVADLEQWKNDNEVECLRRNVRDEFPLRGLGPYQFLRELGRGGMGIVFEAVREDSERRFALKLFPWRFATDMAQWRECFRREAATIAGLKHPNIVRVYSFGVRGGYCYYVMQLVQGVSLDLIVRRLRESTKKVRASDLLRAKPPKASHADRKERNKRPQPDQNSPGEPAELPDTTERLGLSRDSWHGFATIGLQVASALQHAHAQGVLHNDMKPANLILTDKCEVIVTDFGVERRTQADLTKSGDHAMGTLRFMAPERLLGVCDARSDVYSLGATLYELVTQTPAFHASQERLLIQHILKSKLRPPRQLNSRIPRALETIILNAMARDPAERYPTASALATDLTRFLQGEPIQRRRPGLTRRIFNWFRSRFPQRPPAPM